MKNRILVTGANGYIGSHVVDELKKMGAYVIACDVTPMDNRADKKVLASIFDGEINLERFDYPDTVIHLAWRDGFIHSSRTHLDDLEKHFNFLSSLIKMGVKNVAVMGSMHEVGYYEGKIDENTPCHPLSNYGIAKNELRKKLFDLKKQYDFNLYWIRGFYVTGDDRNNHSIFSKLLEADEKGDKLFPFTSGKNKYDFIDINQLAKYISIISTQDEVTGIINACSGEPIPLAEKVESFIRDNKLNIKLMYNAFPDRPYDSSEIYGDTSKLSIILKNNHEVKVK